MNQQSNCPVLAGLSIPVIAHFTSTSIVPFLVFRLERHYSCYFLIGGIILVFCTRSYLNCYLDSGRTVSFSSFDDRRSLRDSSDHILFHHRAAQIQCFHDWRVVHSNDLRNASKVILLSCASLTSSALAPVTVPDYIAKVQSIFDVKRFASISQGDPKLDLMDDRIGARQGTSVGAWGSSGKSLIAMALRLRHHVRSNLKHRSSKCQKLRASCSAVASCRFVTERYQSFQSVSIFCHRPSVRCFTFVPNFGPLRTQWSLQAWSEDSELASVGELS